MKRPILSSGDTPSTDIDVTTPVVSRRQMLPTSAGGLISTSILRNVSAATSPDDVGDKTPHVNFTLNGKSAGADVMGLDISAVAAPNLTYPPATPDDLDETGKVVQSAKRRWIGVKADIRDMPAMNATVDRAIKEFGKLDIVVANASIQAYGPFAETSEQDWNNVININLIGSANTLRAALPHMLSRKYGRIVMISSGQGRHGFMDGSAYSASKWGIIGFMKSLAWEVGQGGITVNCVEPGLVDTPLTRNPGRWRELIRMTGKQPPENPTEQEVIATAAPSSVMGIPWMQPDEVAPVVVFLCTDAANRVSGACYDATAGESAKFTA